MEFQKKMLEYLRTHEAYDSNFVLKIIQGYLPLLKIYLVKCLRRLLRSEILEKMM